MRSRILVVPSVDDLDDFAHLMSHLGHYLAHVHPERVVVLVEPPVLQEAEAWLAAPVPPRGFADPVAARIVDLSTRVDLVSWPADLDYLALTSDLILDWHAERSELRPWRDVRGQYRLNRSYFEIDWRRRRLGGSWLADVARVITSGRTFDPSGQSLTNALVSRLGVAETAYLIATGPSARSALEHDLSDGIRIACNTVVLDDDLMEHVRPNVLTFADPIFHFGPSTYAEHFQRAVLERAEQYNFTVVTTERFAPLLRVHAPEIADRVIGLRQGRTDWPDNFDLTHRAAVRPYPNILTMLMLPLATTLARSATLFGFDGRDPDDQYFWKHGRTVQFDAEMEDIRQVHPGFFDVDYEDYYHSHVTTLDRILNQLDARGYAVRPETPSHMPPLRRRGRLRRDPQVSHPDPDRPMLVSLTPDWIEDFGHFGPFERRIRESATGAGFEHVALASRGLRPKAGWQVPLFTEASYGTFPVRFGEELSAALRSLSPCDGSVVAFYTADVWHVPALQNLARQFPGLRFVANLMRAHDWLSEALTNFNARAHAQVNLLTACFDLSEGSNLDIAVDTAALQRDVELLTGHRPLVWPMITASNLDSHSEMPERRGPIHLVVPVHAQHVKGFPQVVELAERLRARLGRGEAVLLARWVRQPTSAPVGIDELAERFIDAGGQLVRDNLTDDEYAKLVLSADIVIVPYRLNPFRTRTSGVVVDALLAGKPVVAVRGTWGGDLVERFGAGATYEDGNVTQLLRAIDHVSDHLERFGDKLAEARPGIVAHHHPDRLIEFFQERAKADVTVEVSTEAVAGLTNTAEQLRELFRWKDVTSLAGTIAGLVRDDDRLRGIDELRDSLEEMQRAIRWRDRQARGSSAPADSTMSLSELVFPRSSRAHIDEAAFVAELVDPYGSRPGRMVDVGAHRGSALNHFVRRGWTVRAFEPDARHAAELQARFADDERVVVDNRAVADVTGEERTFYVSTESPGISGLSAFRESHVPAGEVRTVTLRDALDEQHVSVLKVDTEGFDLQVLRGFPWERDMPEVIICEFEDRKTRSLGYTASDLGDFLVGKGYQVWVSEWHPVIRYGIRHDWHRLVRFPTALAHPDAWGNFIAFQVPRSTEAVVRHAALLVEREGPAPEEPTQATDDASERDERTDTADDTPSSDGANEDTTPAQGDAQTDNRPTSDESAPESSDTCSSDGGRRGEDGSTPAAPPTGLLSLPDQQGQPSRSASRRPSRGEALSQAFKGSLFPVLPVALVLFVVALGAWGTGVEWLGVSALAAGGTLLTLAIMIIAVRLERRIPTNPDPHED